MLNTLQETEYKHRYSVTGHLILIHGPIVSDMDSSVL